MRFIAAGLLLSVLIGAPIPDSPAVPQARAVEVRYTCALNYDGTCDTEYPAGDKPEPAIVCDTWTCDTLGTSTGEINEVSATELEMAVSSPNDWDDIVIAYKTFTDSDVQVCATVPDQASWTGYAEDFTDFGVTIQDDTAEGAWFFRVFAAYVNDVPRRKYGTETLNSSQQGDPATALPETLCATHDEETDTFCGWQSTDGTNFALIGACQVRDTGVLHAGVWGTSQEAGQTSFATLTNVTATSTITIGTSPPVFLTAPTAGAVSSTSLQVFFTADQTGDVYGVACPDGQTFPTVAQVKLGNCTGDVAAVSAFTQPVTANFAANGHFTGLTASTTYDTHYVPVSDTTGDASAITTLANQTTDDLDPPPPDSNCIAPLASPTNSVYGSALDRTANIGCRSGDDIVLGWDWSVIDGYEPGPDSGFFGGSDDPSYFQGNRLVFCNLSWRELESTDDDYNFLSWDLCRQQSASSDFEGIMLNVRAMVSDISPCNASLPMSGEGDVTAPAWLITAVGAAGQTQESCHTSGNFQITNLEIYNATVKAEFLELIEEFAARAYGQHITAQIVHGVSSSSGEEWTGAQASNPLAEAAMLDIIDAWAAAAGTHAKKLAWLKEVPASLYNQAVEVNGFGARGGAIENWARTQYTPGNTSQTGQIYTAATGKLSISSAFLPISENRHWQDQNEVYNSRSSTDPAKLHHNYRMASWRMLQMRRNVVWPSNNELDDRLDNYVSVQLGHNATSSPEAGALLMRTWGYSGGAAIELNNFERWLYQVDALGATTPSSACCRVTNGQNQTNNANLIESLWYTDVGRRENNASNTMGFAIDDAFWSTSLTQRAWVKVTYIDSGTQTITFTWADGTKTAVKANSGATAIRTATWYIDDFRAPAAGFGEDFSIDVADTDILMVRIGKCGGSFVSC